MNLVQQRRIVVIWDANRFVARQGDDGERWLRMNQDEGRV